MVSNRSRRVGQAVEFAGYTAPTRMDLRFLIESVGAHRSFGCSAL